MFRGRMSHGEDGGHKAWEGGESLGGTEQTPLGGSRSKTHVGDPVASRRKTEMTHIRAVC